VPVFGAEVVVHVDAAGKVTTANGLAPRKAFSEAVLG